MLGTAAPKKEITLDLKYAGNFNKTEWFIAQNTFPFSNYLLNGSITFFLEISSSLFQNNIVSILWWQPIKHVCWEDGLDMYIEGFWEQGAEEKIWM